MRRMRNDVTTLKRTATLLLAIAFIALVAAAGNAQAPLKVLRTSFRSVETGFDPQRIEDSYSSAVCQELFETALTFDYLARPVKITARAAMDVPTVQGGLVYTLKFRPGIFFADDPAFKGQKRELTARDQLYTLERLIDPSNRSPYSWLVENRIEGLDALAEQAKRTGRFDYDAPVSGLKLLDRYTLQVRLLKPDYNFIYIFAMPQTGIVAREAIEAYGEDTWAHPVGTGAFKLTEWVRRSKIVLERNENFRGAYLDTTYADPEDPWDREVVQHIKGKRLPLLDRVEIYPMEAEQPRFLSFMNKEQDLLQEMPFTFVNQVLPNGKIAPNLAKEGVRAFIELQPELVYDSYNMEDPIVGGYDAQHVALRRAMNLGFDRDQEIALVFRGQGLAAQSVSAPGIVGYNASFTARDQDYDPARAKALLDMFGYVDRDADGYREQPDGSPLTIDIKYRAGSTRWRQQAELWVKSMAGIGIRMTASPVQFSDLLVLRKLGKIMISQNSWIADYPDTQNFVQLLYGPNTNISNDSRFRLPEYDRLYEQSLQLPDGPERNRLYDEMSRLMVAYAPWRLHVYSAYTHLVRSWVHGYKKHPIYHFDLMYLDIDTTAQAAAVKSK